MNTRSQRGFSLIELMITISVLGILVMLALPGFSRWIANTQIRTMAESIQNGLRLAQREAAARNDSVTLILTNATAPACSSTAATNGLNWVICSGSTKINQNVGKAGSAGAVVASDFSSIVFDGLGRTNLGSAATVTVTSSAGSVDGIRSLNVLVSPAGKVRLCDPMLTAGDPAACS
jgi:type IV fimbrial biogenesis protein FimT